MSLAGLRVSISRLDVLMEELGNVSRPAIQRTPAAAMHESLA